MTGDFWLYRPSILWEHYHDFIPSRQRGYQFYNAVTRLLIYIIVTLMIFNLDYSIFLIFFILINILGYVRKDEGEKTKCREPTINNPMMNPLLTSDDLQLEACKDKQTDKYLLYGINEDSNVMFRNKLVRRTFITFPVTKYPNDINEFNKIVDLDGCKTKGKRCTSYRDIRFNR